MRWKKPEEGSPASRPVAWLTIHGHADGCTCIGCAMLNDAEWWAARRGADRQIAAELTRLAQEGAAP